MFSERKMKALAILLMMAGCCFAQTAEQKQSILDDIDALRAKIDAIVVVDGTPAPEPGPGPAPNPDPIPNPEPDPPPSGTLPMWDHHHMVPDYRSVANTIVAAGESVILTGDVGIVAVFGNVHFSGEVRYDTIAQYAGEMSCDSDCTFVRADIPLHPDDVAERGGGIVVVGGTCQFEGDECLPFARTVNGYGIGSSEIAVDVTTNWKAGDRMLFPHTRQNRVGFIATFDDETRLLLSDAATTLVVAPLENPHPSCPTNDWGMVRHPHVANLTRSLVFRSENPSITDRRRGHTIVVGDGRMIIRNASFVDMGRTRADVVLGPDNKEASYDVHAHHVHLPGTMDITGCVFEGSLKWGATIHQSTGCNVDDCIVYDCDGAGIALENGMEQGNFIRRNLVCRVTGGLNGGHGGGESQNRGASGTGIWASCAGNTIDDNVVYGTKMQAYVITGYGVSVPKKVNVSFSGNEAVGSYNALWLAWSQGRGEGDFTRQQWGDFIGWNCGYGLFAYHEFFNTFESLTFIADPHVSSQNLGSHGGVDVWGNGQGGRRGIGLSFSGYENVDTIIKQCRVSGFNVGLYISTEFAESSIITGEFRNHVNVLQDNTTSLTLNATYLGHNSGPGVQNAREPIPNDPANMVVVE